MYKTSVSFTDNATEIINKHKLIMNKNEVKSNHTFADSVNDLVEKKNTK